MASIPAVIETYVSAYNVFDVEAMIECLSDDVHFMNLTGGEVTAETRGRDEFAKLAHLGVSVFQSRRQLITGAISVGNRTMIGVDYEAVVAVDQPNGWKAGQKLAFFGASYFEVVGGKISMIVDSG